MGIFDDIIKSLVEQNDITLSGGVTIALTAGGIRTRGEISCQIADRKRNKTLARALVPVEAELSVPELVFPVAIVRS